MSVNFNPLILPGNVRRYAQDFVGKYGVVPTVAIVAGAIFMAYKMCTTIASFIQSYVEKLQRGIDILENYLLLD